MAFTREALAPPQTRPQRFGRLSLILAALTVGGKALGMVREMLIAGRFGATDETDAFYLAFSLTVALPMGLLIAIPQSLLPQYQALAKDDRPAAAELYGAALLLAVLALGGLAAATFVGAAPLIERLAPRFSAETATSAVRWTRTMLPLLPLLGAASVIVSVAQARGHFVLVQFAVALLNVGAVLGLLVGPLDAGVGAAAIGYLLGSLAMAATLLSYPLRERLWPGLSGAGARRAARILGSVVVIVALANGGGYAVELVERMFWVQLPSGQLSCLGYAQRLAALPHFVLAGSLVVVLLPELSGQREEGAAVALAQRALRLFMVVIVLPLAVLAALGQPVVRLVYGGGALSSEAVALTAVLLVLLLPTMTLSVVRVVVDTLCFSQGCVWVPVTYGALRVLLMLGLFPIAGPRWGAMGLVLTLAAIDVVLLPLELAVARRVFGLRFPGLAGFGARLGSAAALGAATSWGAWHVLSSLLPPSGWLTLGVEVVACGLFGLAVGVGAASLVRAVRLSDLFPFGRSKN